MATNPSPSYILGLLGFGTAVSLLGDATLYTVLPNPAIAAEAGVTLGMVGVLLGVNRGVRLLFNSPVGWLYDRFPRRLLLVVSLVLGTLSSMVYAVGQGFAPLFVGRVMWGLAWSLLWIGGNAVVLDISSEHDRGRNNGRYQMWFFIGVAGASLLGGLFTDWLGFRNGLWLSAILIGLAALLWAFFLPETRRPSTTVPRHQRGYWNIRGQAWRVVFTASLPLFTYRFVAAGVLAATTIIWLEELFGPGLSLAGLLIPLATLTGLLRALTSITSISGAPLAGWFSDRMGRRWPVVGVTSLIAAAGLWMMGLQGEGVVLLFVIAGAFISQVSSGAISAMTPAIMGDRLDHNQGGRALGFVYTMGDLGSMLGPPLGLGLLGAGWFSVGELYQGCGILFALLGVFAWLQGRVEKRRIPIGI